MSDSLELQKIIGQVAAAYFGNSHVSPAEISTVINQIASSLAAVGEPQAEPATETGEQAKLTPAQIRKSIGQDALISFEDNKPYKTLRRHLSVKGLTPEDYRAKWGLPADYPTVAPAYSEARSQLAKSAGLGSQRGGRGRAAPAAPAAQKEPKARDAVPTRGRPRKQGAGREG